ncbi:MAG TPA: SGNH/GDSL hydrolase family protein [Solirubrobacteraceae bacterium]|nr:SGNH/GDSL hydrolase family protein [Solirubrobacteraceae bacterium]
MSRRLLCITTVVGALMALAAAPSLAGASVPYVSLGDSFTSGPFILPFASGAPLDCLQSARDYSHLTASALGLSLSDVSCSGATTSNFSTAQYSDQPPQFNALNSSTQVVSVGIGGNDNGLFLNTLITCGAEDLVFPFGTPCKSTYGHTLAEKIAADGPVIGAALAHVHSVSPSAKVFVVGYPDILLADSASDDGRHGVPERHGEGTGRDAQQRGLRKRRDVRGHVHAEHRPRRVQVAEHALGRTGAAGIGRVLGAPERKRHG